MNADVIEQTKNWIINVVIGCNFCPFAAREIRRNSIHYQVTETKEITSVLQELLAECERLDTQKEIETSFLIFPAQFRGFYDYLNLVAKAETLLVQKGYEGIYQLASFHPDYLFADAAQDDAANYTNRSPYPMLHLLREDSVEKALEKYPDPEDIPDRNIRFAREKGAAYFAQLARKSGK